MTQEELAVKAGYTDRSSISKIEKGEVDLTQSKINLIAKALDISPTELAFGGETEAQNTEFETFAVIGDVAAGYDNLAVELSDAETVKIHKSYLSGRNAKEFFVLRIKGNSMYPDYRDGDKVLVLRQNSLNRSGQVGVVIYDDEMGTIKRVEYKTGENWLRLIPINPNYPPVTLENEELEHCRILGIPKLVIREIDE